MYLAEALVVFGGAVLWKRGKLIALLPMILGCLIAMASRPYVGWFLTAAAAAVVLHASLTRQRGLRSFALTATCVVLAVAFVPVVWAQSSDEKLQELQASQDANAADDANLSLEQVDYSTRRNLIVNLPQRIGDVVLRPYVWQTRTRVSSSARSARSSCSAAWGCSRSRSSAIDKLSFRWPRPWCTRPPSCWLPTQSAPATPERRTATARTSWGWRCAW